MNKNSITLLGYPVFTGEFSEMLLAENRVINTINPHSYVVAKNDKLFSNSLKCSDILLPDGIGIVMAINILFKKRMKTFFSMILQIKKSKTYLSRREYKYVFC